MDVMTELRSISLPPFKRNLLLHPFNLPETLSNKIFQSFFFSFAALNGSPRYLIGSLVRGDPKVFSNSFYSCLFMAKHIKVEFSLFNFRPEISPKIFTNSPKACIAGLVPSTKKTMSSAYCKMGVRFLLLDSEYPLMTPTSVILHAYLASPSTVRLKIKGARGHPCLTLR